MGGQHNINRQENPKPCCSFANSGSLEILFHFYRAVIENVLTFSITVWFGSASVHDKKLLDGIARVASKLRGCELQSLESIFTIRTQRKVRYITSSQDHPAHHLLQCLPSWRRFRTTKKRTYCKPDLKIKKKRKSSSAICESKTFTLVT